MSASQFRSGVPVRHGEVTALRRPLDPRYDDHERREVQFSKHYLEGKIVVEVVDEMLDDMAVDLWAFVEQRLDEQAHRLGGHRRDGSLV